jgi:hypothetical protein
LQPRSQPRGLLITIINPQTRKKEQRSWISRSQLGGLLVVASTREKWWRPPRSKSWQPKGSLVAVAKKEEKEDDDQHDDHD